MFLKFLFAVSFSYIFITIQYTVFRKSFSTSYVSLYIYIHITIRKTCQRIYEIPRIGHISNCNTPSGFVSYIYIYSVLFFLHNCPLLIPLHNTEVLIKICRF